MTTESRGDRAPSKGGGARRIREPRDDSDGLSRHSSCGQGAGVVSVACPFDEKPGRSPQVAPRGDRVQTPDEEAPVVTSLTDAERDDLSRKNAEANKRSSDDVRARGGW